MSSDWVPQRKARHDEISRDILDAVFDTRQELAVQNYQWLHLAMVDEVETESSDPTNPLYGKFSGRVTVRMLTMEGKLVRCLVAWGAAGPADFCGGLPTKNSMCVVGWIPGAMPLILAFYPTNYRLLVDSKATLEELQPGEKIMQASTFNADAEQVPAATVKLDAKGRFVVRSQGNLATVVVGPDPVSDPSTLVRLTTQRCEVTVDDTGLVRITGDLVVDGTVKLGGEVGTKPFVLGDFLTLYNTHTHPSPGAPPAQFAGPEFETVATEGR